MLDLIFFLAVVGVEIYALVEAIRTSASEIRNLPKWGWIVIILLFGLFGSIAWYIAGRPKGNGGPRAPRKSRGTPVPPDDNPDFLRSL
jgi:hypothetical protein